MYQTYKGKPFNDKEWLPFTGATIEECRHSALLGGASLDDDICIAQLDSELSGTQPVPKNAKFMGKL